MNDLGPPVVIGTWALAFMVVLLDCFIVTWLSDWVTSNWRKR